MKKLLIVLLLFPFIAHTQQTVQDTLWKKSGNATFNFSQVSLNNWAAGGKSSMSGVFLVDYAANYKKAKLSWDNAFDFRYGFLKEEDVKLRKSDDKIDFSSKLGYEAKGNWNYAALANFKSQFAPGYNYDDKKNSSTVISRFLAPAYLNVGVGMDYKTDNFSAFISPLSGKFTFVNDKVLSAAGAFGVDPCKKSRSELGALVKLLYKKDILENVTFDTKLDLFSNYLENPQNVDVDWTAKVNMKINDYLSANIVTQLIYDDDIKILDPKTGKSAPRIQFMEMFGIGLTTKF